MQPEECRNVNSGHFCLQVFQLKLFPVSSSFIVLRSCINNNTPSSYVTLFICISFFMCSQNTSKRIASSILQIRKTARWTSLAGQPVTMTIRCSASSGHTVHARTELYVSEYIYNKDSDSATLLVAQHYLILLCIPHSKIRKHKVKYLMVH